MPYSEQVKKDAAAAAQYIRKHGWKQGAGIVENSSGKCIGCAVVTLVFAVGCDDNRDENVWSAIEQETGSATVIAWNDKPGRTKEEVLAVFDRIANS